MKKNCQIDRLQKCRKEKHDVFFTKISSELYSKNMVLKYYETYYQLQSQTNVWFWFLFRKNHSFFYLGCKDELRNVLHI